MGRCGGLSRDFDLFWIFITSVTNWTLLIYLWTREGADAGSLKDGGSPWPVLSDDNLRLPLDPRFCGLFRWVLTAGMIFSFLRACWSVVAVAKGEHPVQHTYTSDEIQDLRSQNKYKFVESSPVSIGQIITLVFLTVLRLEPFFFVFMTTNRNSFGEFMKETRFIRAVFECIPSAFFGTILFFWGWYGAGWEIFSEAMTHSVYMLAMVAAGFSYIQLAWTSASVTSDSLGQLFIRVDEFVFALIDLISKFIWASFLAVLTGTYFDGEWSLYLFVVVPILWLLSTRMFFTVMGARKDDELNRFRFMEIMGRFSTVLTYVFSAFTDLGRGWLGCFIGLFEVLAVLVVASVFAPGQDDLGAPWKETGGAYFILSVGALSLALLKFLIFAIKTPYQDGDLDKVVIQAVVEYVSNEAPRRIPFQEIKNKFGLDLNQSKAMCAELQYVHHLIVQEEQQFVALDVLARSRSTDHRNDRALSQTTVSPRIDMSRKTVDSGTLLLEENSESFRYGANISPRSQQIERMHSLARRRASVSSSSTFVPPTCFPKSVPVTETGRSTSMVFPHEVVFNKPLTLHSLAETDSGSSRSTLLPPLAPKTGHSSDNTLRSTVRSATMDSLRGNGPMEIYVQQVFSQKELGSRSQKSSACHKLFVLKNDSIAKVITKYCKTACCDESAVFGIYWTDIQLMRDYRIGEFVKNEEMLFALIAPQSSRPRISSGAMPRVGSQPARYASTIRSEASNLTKVQTYSPETQSPTSTVEASLTSPRLPPPPPRLNPTSPMYMETQSTIMTNYSTDELV